MLPTVLELQGRCLCPDMHLMANIGTHPDPNRWMALHIAVRHQRREVRILCSAYAM